jgi:hypothetical protein
MTTPNTDVDTDEDMIQREPSRQQLLREPDSGMHEATAAIPNRPVRSPFNNNASVLLAANAWSGVENATSKGTLRISNPYGDAMMQSLKSTGTGEAQQ